MNELAVDWNELELAFSEVSETQNFFDLRSGAGISVVRGYEDEAEIQTLIQQHPDRFEKIAPLDAGFTRSALMAFLPLVAQKQLRAELELALKGPAGLTRAMDVLRTHGDVMGQFHRHEQESFWKHVNLFLGNCGVKPANRAPEPELFHEVA